MPAYHPPFQLTHRMTAAMTQIAELLGAWKAVNQNTLLPELRRSNRIRTIQASLAVEQNTLTLEQVTAVLDGKIVMGSPREIQEVRNAFAAYEAMERWHPHRLADLLSAHALLMAGLLDDAGQLRRSDAGIYQGKRLVHMAPPASQLPRLIQNLLRWLETTDAHPLIASAAFHYEFEFIHPFSDGNGRMGRLWQTLILSRWQPMLAYLPVETVIKSRQQEYYLQLGLADGQSDCSTFIEFLLTAIETSLHEAINLEMRVKTRVQTRVKTPQQILELLKQHPEFSLAEVARAIGRSVSTVERAVARLQQENRLRYHGPKKGGKWEVLP